MQLLRLVATLCAVSTSHLTDPDAAEVLLVTRPKTQFGLRQETRGFVGDFWANRINYYPCKRGPRTKA